MSRSTLQPTRSSNASSVFAPGSTNQRWLTPSRTQTARFPLASNVRFGSEHIADPVGRDPEIFRDRKFGYRLPPPADVVRHNDICLALTEFQFRHVDDSPTDGAARPWRNGLPTTVPREELARTCLADGLAYTGSVPSTASATMCCGASADLRNGTFIRAHFFRHSTARATIAAMS